jgi:hypothetical protein
LLKGNNLDEDDPASPRFLPRRSRFSLEKPEFAYSGAT